MTIPVSPRFVRPVTLALFAAVLSACSDVRREPAACLATDTIPGIPRLREHLAAEEQNGFSGVVLIGNGDEVAFTREYGDAAEDSGPTPFWLTSISKPVTATAVLRLVEEGYIRLDTRIADVIPGVPGPWQETTVHDLLAHRSGLPHAHAADGIADRAEAARAILAQKREKPRGEFLYSNDGYTLLAMVIEHASGMAFETYVRTRVLDRAGMRQSGFWGERAAPVGVARRKPDARERPAATVWRDDAPVANWGYRGPTGMFATAEDLHRFAGSLRPGRLLEGETLSLMLTPGSAEPTTPDAPAYGYGMALRYAGGRLTDFYHAGNEDWLGHNGLMGVVGNDVFIVLSNSGDVDDVSWAHRINAGMQVCLGRVASPAAR